MRKLLSFKNIVSPALLFAFSISGAEARDSKSAQITRIVRQVNVVRNQSKTSPALPNEKINWEDAVQTGDASAAEIQFSDRTILRLGSNTRLAFEQGGQGLSLTDGSLFLDMPKQAGNAPVKMMGVMAAVKGTTALCEYHGGIYKFLVLQGTGRVYRPGHFGDSVLVRAGQMAIGKPEEPVSDPVDFDIGRFLKTSKFIVGCPALGSTALMTRESAKQERQKAKKVLLETNLVIFGGGTQVSLLNPGKTAEAPSSTGSPAPSAKAAPAIDPGAIEQAMGTRK